MKKYKTIIVKDRLDKLDIDLSFIDSHLEEYGNVFYIMSTKYDEYGSVKFDCLDVLNEFINRNYFYKNIIVYPKERAQSVAFNDNVGYIIWVSNNNKNKYFDKDPIREKHIWKDVEWGKRSRNYNEKGKDPGNVWIPTEDDGCGNITNHILLQESEIINRLIKMSGNDYFIIENEENKEDSSLGNIEYKLENLLMEDRKNINKEIYKVYFKTSENMCDIDDNSISQAITSPPYWDLKDYFKEGQIGQESYELYLKRLEHVFSEVYKKLNNRGSFCVNINIRRRLGKVTLNPKDIVDICKKIGYFYKGIIIWHKSSAIPVGESNLADRFEFVFIFTKNKYYKFNKRVLASFSDYKNDKMNGLGFWNINRKAGSVGKGYKHPAIYPKELVRRLILSGSIEEDIILDPFLGSGTSLISAIENDRNFIGFEYNEQFKELIEHRLEKEGVLKKQKIEYIL